MHEKSAYRSTRRRVGVRGTFPNTGASNRTGTTRCSVAHQPQSVPRTSSPPLPGRTPASTAYGHGTASSTSSSPDESAHTASLPADNQGSRTPAQAAPSPSRNVLAEPPGTARRTPGSPPATHGRNPAHTPDTSSGARTTSPRSAGRAPGPPNAGHASTSARSHPRS